MPDPQQHVRALIMHLIGQNTSISLTTGHTKETALSSIQCFLHQAMHKHVLEDLFKHDGAFELIASDLKQTHLPLVKQVDSSSIGLYHFISPLPQLVIQQPCFDSHPSEFQPSVPLFIGSNLAHQIIIELPLWSSKLSSVSERGTRSKPNKE